MPLNLIGSAPPEAFAAALQTAGAAIETTGRIELDRATEKHLRPLGYEVGLWQNAIALLQSRHAKNRLHAGLAAFIGQWLPKDVPAASTAEFSLLLGQNDRGVFLQGSSLAKACDPIWWALLRLPALRDAWTADLRASHFEHLLKVVPHAWVVDPAPMVPGTEIAGLGLAAWSHVEQLREQGRSFALRSPSAESVQVLNADLPPADWRAAIEQALDSGDGLLVELPTTSTWWLTRYGPKDGQVALLEAYQAVTTESGWLIQKVALG